MSIKKLFQQSKQSTAVGKYLKKSAVGDLSGGIESAHHLSESLRRRDEFIPSLDYGDPAQFAKYGSAEKYYENAFNHILQNYPYDGSKYEKEKFYNDLNPLEKYIFNERYPKSTGFVNIGTNYGTAVSHSSHYYNSPKTEYIQIKGGPHSGTLYSSNYRQNNLEFGGPSGSTVEFFLSKSAIPGGGEDVTTQSPRQVIFDLWNGVRTGSIADDETNGCFGNLRIELSKSLEDRFLVTMLSGTTGYVTQSIPTTGNIGKYITGSSWNQFAFVFNTSESSPTIDFYINGVCHEAGIAAAGHQAGQISLVTGTLIGNLGALRNEPSGVSGPVEGYGKLSGAIDEFRFWKSARTGEQIGRNWFTDINGGSNTQDANVSLGVYYKFNEGISGTGSVDNLVLDYSGRISNGTWTGYAAGARDTGSAITLQSLTQSISSRTEVEDPIIFPSASVVTVRRDELKQIGEQHDRTNTAYVLNTIPDWIVEQDANFGSELKNVTQIMANYFDTLHSQISSLTKIKAMDYVSGSATGSINEFPYNDRLVENLGMEAPELFENADLLAHFLKRGNDINFEQDLSSIKNTLYKNLYNNLNHIFKSKGNEKAIRNFIRCFGVDEDVVNLSIYSDNSTYKLETNYRADTSNKKYADFTGLFKRDSSDATIYQYPNPDLPESYGIISGSSGSLTLIDFGFTAEAEFVFPNRSEIETLSYTPVQVVTSSLFGWHTPRGEDKLLSSSTDTSWMWAQHDAGLQVVAIKSASQMAEVLSPAHKVKDVFFKVLDRHNNVILTSSVFTNVYDNQKWNIALSVHPKRFPFAQNSSSNANVHDGYDLDFYAVNYDSGIKRNSLYATASLTYKSGSDIVSGPKRFYMGAARTNFSGTVVTASDVRGSSLRYWTDVLSTGTIDMHARSVDNYGRFNPTRQAYTDQKYNPGIYIPQIETLALHWDFADITGSDSSGRFNVNDFSSGSLDSGSRGSLYFASPQHINYRQHTGRGDHFPASSKPIRKELLYTDRMELPEYAISSDMIKLKNIDDEAYAPLMRPERLYYAIEKSMYRSVSERMLHLFSSVEELNNLIGDPVNRYRPNYKAMEKLRQIFFSKVGNTPDLQKYLDYYQWVDMSLGQMLEQLFPASVKFAPGVRNVVESHLLERAKFKYTFMGNRKDSSPQSVVQNPPQAPVISNVSLEDVPPAGQEPVRPVVNMNPNRPVLPPKNVTAPKKIKNVSKDGNVKQPLGWEINHAPLPSSLPRENENTFWWMTRAERHHPTISQSNPGVMVTREAVLKQAQSFYLSRGIVSISGEVPQAVQVTNADVGNQKETKQEVGVAGVSFGTFDEKPQGDMDLDEKELIPNLKNTQTLSASIEGRDVDGKSVLPFTPVSSTVTTGYQKQLQSAGITNTDFANLHVKPAAAQTPFTLTHVGGQQSRQAPVGAKFDASKTVRKESYKLEVAGGGGGSFETNKTGPVPKGQYKRGSGASRPVNIENIQTSTGSIAPEGGVQVLGNYTKNYEIVNISNRDDTNIDFTFHSDQYFTGSDDAISYAALVNAKMPTAFLTSISRRAAGFTGSADYQAPRQRSDVRVNKTVIVDRFSSPGSKLDSKQLFRDGPSDQYSPNNALPFRNIDVRQKHNTLLKRHTGWGGFQTASLNTLLTRHDSTDLTPFNEGVVVPPAALYGDDLSEHTASLVAIHKTQRNTILRPKFVSGNLNDPANQELYVTGALRDNAFVTRPIPDGDRLSWFMRLSHSQGTVGDWPGRNYADNFHKFILSSSRFPADITIYSSSIAAQELGSLYPAAALKMSGVFRNKSNAFQYIWEANGLGGWVPWTQTRFGQYTNKGTFNSKQNLYMIDASKITLQSEEVEFPTGKRLIATTKAETVTDLEKSLVSAYDRSLNDGGTIKGGNRVSHNVGKKYKEPILTSRYKPIIHQIKTYRGSANSTQNKSVDVTLKYSYGNELQGFANKGLNIDLGNKQSFKLGTVKRPYEILRDTFVDNVDPSTDGVELIKMMSYEETIYPKEIYTYLSSSRTRNVYKNNFWRSDIATGSATKRPAGEPADVFIIKTFTGIPDLIDEGNMEEYNNSWERRQIATAEEAVTGEKGIRSSFGYRYTMDEQYPTGTFASDASGNNGWAPPLEPTAYGLSGEQGAGSASMWPLDSFYYCEQYPSINRDGNYTSPLGLPTGTFSGTNIGTPLMYAMASTLPAGELMMPHYGIVMSGNAANSGSQRGAIRWNTSSINTSQYVYTVPTEVIRVTDLANQSAKFIADARAVGGALTRPGWTAGRIRKFVDGPQRRNQAPARFPWYNSYEDWCSEVKNKGKDYTIIPEYRISTLMPKYKELGNFASSLSAALDITGATPNVDGSPFNSVDEDFFPRYATSDVAEYLKVFMAKDSKDSQFNKEPRHLEIKSDAIMKMLPYDGFYPVLRTLELATLFSKSYDNCVIYEGEGYTNGAPNYKDFLPDADPTGIKIQRGFRAISRPFFAPGIIYNSIKAGMAVSYPIIRKNMSALQSCSIQDPLHGHLSESILWSYATGGPLPTGTSEAAITIPGGRRRRKEGAADNFDFFKLDVGVEGDQLKDQSRGAPHNMFYSDVIPFEGIFKPLEHISDAKRGIVLADTNPTMYAEITASIPTSGNIVTFTYESGETEVAVTATFQADDDLYRLGMSNFMANIPTFFLKEQKDGGFLSKFVAEIPTRAPADNPAGAAPAQQTEARTVRVSKNKAYIMEIGVKQTERHMMYSNPAAFGPSTATGSFDWNEMLCAGPGATTLLTSVEYGVAATASLEPNNFDIAAINGKFIGITGSVQDGTEAKVSFEFNLGASTPARASSTEYTIGTDGVGDPVSLGNAIGAAISLARSNGELMMRADVNASTGVVLLTQQLKSKVFNAQEIVGSAVQPDQTNAGVTALGPFHGGQTPPVFTIATAEQSGGVPQGREWPYHRAEFAPFTPAYYYGPSIVRITYTPRENGEVTLEDILSGEDLFVEYNNENGYYYDFDSGSFIGANEQVLSLDGVPAYGFNRAWQNRQDIDSSIVVDNVFPTDGADLSPKDKNKWTIMPKWECPILDFPTDIGQTPHDFSASVEPGTHEPKVEGMWHQYGTMPSGSSEGIFMYISDVSLDSTELRLLGNPTGSGAQRTREATGTFLSGTAKVQTVKKVPKFVIDAGREVDSLARLVGFKEEDIQVPGAFLPSKARRLGTLAENNEKVISEAIIAMPYYMDPSSQQMRVMTLKGNGTALGPKIKEFRRAFTKYSLPPSLKKQLSNLLPPNYPKVSSYINPFGGDDYDSLLSSDRETSVPLVYLMEHSVALSRQDLADIWQGIMPDIAASMKSSVSAIDHYMPGDAASAAGSKTIFPELLLKELELGLPRNGHPRVDMLDIPAEGKLDGFIPQIRWMVYRVKQRGVETFSRFISEELNGPEALSYDSVFGVIADNLPEEQKEFLRRKKASYTKGLFVSDELGLGGNTYNWPYDYFSLIELGKMSMKVGFRPELEREIEDISEEQENNSRSRAVRQQQQAVAAREEEKRMATPPPSPVIQTTSPVPPPVAPPIPQLPEGAVLVDQPPLIEGPDGLPPEALPQQPQVDPNMDEQPLDPASFDVSKVPEQYREEFQNMTPAQMERRRSEEMSKAEEQRQPAPSFTPPPPPRGGGGSGGGGSGGGGY